MAPVLEACLEAAVVLGATRDCRPGLQKLWWAFERLDLPPLARDEAKALLWSVVDRARLPDAALFEATVLEQAAGNPHAIVEMARQVPAEGPVDIQTIRALQHGAGLRYLDLTPVLLLVAAGLVAARFVALGPRQPGPLHPGGDAGRAVLRGARAAHAGRSGERGEAPRGPPRSTCRSRAARRGGTGTSGRSWPSSTSASGSARSPARPSGRWSPRSSRSATRPGRSPGRADPPPARRLPVRLAGAADRSPNCSAAAPAPAPASGPSRRTSGPWTVFSAAPGSGTCGCPAPSRRRT